MTHKTLIAVSLVCQIVAMQGWLKNIPLKNLMVRALWGRDIGNDFGRFSVSFFEGRISYIRAACNYPTSNANFKSWISDIRLLMSR